MIAKPTYADYLRSIFQKLTKITMINLVEKIYIINDTYKLKGYAVFF